LPSVAVRSRPLAFIARPEPSLYAFFSLVHGNQDNQRSLRLTEDEALPKRTLPFSVHVPPGAREGPFLCAAPAGTIGSMGEPKKRFPLWVFACAVLSVLGASFVGFVELVGRQSTIIGRYEQVKDGTTYDEVCDIINPPPYSMRRWSRSAKLPDGRVGVTVGWTEGPGSVSFLYDPATHRVSPAGSYIEQGFSFWHLRRWAEKAYAAIHGPRR
jgi:hypothetical protein